MTVNLNYVRAITREMKEGWKARRKGRGDKERQCYYSSQAVNAKYFFSLPGFEFDIET